MIALNLPPQREAAFFAALRLSNGTFKTTRAHRMDDLNAFLVQEWTQAGFQPSEIMDVGVSSGVSTVEWIEALERAGFQVRITATDLTLWARRWRLAPGIAVLEEESGQPLQYVVAGVPFRPWRRRLDYVTGYAALAGAVAWVARRLRPHATESSRLMLANQRAVARSDIVWAEDNVFLPGTAALLGPFDAIRAANILNLGYFGPEQIAAAVRNLRSRLRGPGAQLLVNRTVDSGANHATLFCLDLDRRFRTQAMFGDGSEIADIVLAA
jgi:hypothetical protein